MVKVCALALVVPFVAPLAKHVVVGEMNTRCVMLLPEQKEYVRLTVSPALGKVFAFSVMLCGEDEALPFDGDTVR